METTQLAHSASVFVRIVSLLGNFTVVENVRETLVSQVARCGVHRPPIMTVFLPIDPDGAPPPLPAFVAPTENPAAQMSRTIQAIMKAKRIVVICGRFRCCLRTFAHSLPRRRDLRPGRHSRFSLVRRTL